MPNANYLAGRRFEYQVMDDLRREKFEAVRTAGSHGPFDIIAFRTDRKPLFVQCKRVETEKQAEKLIEKFKQEAQPSAYYHQQIRVKVKGGVTLIGTV